MEGSVHFFRDLLPVPFVSDVACTYNNGNANKNKSHWGHVLHFIAFAFNARAMKHLCTYYLDSQWYIVGRPSWLKGSLTLKDPGFLVCHRPPPPGSFRGLSKGLYSCIWYYGPVRKISGLWLWFCKDLFGVFTQIPSLEHHWRSTQ